MFCHVSDGHTVRSLPHTYLGSFPPASCRPRDNPGYRFYYLSYGRVEYLDLAVETSQTHAPDGTLVVDFTHEFLYSLANLFVAVDGASGYVGSLSSSWCTTTNVLQRTRGDAGFDFLSVDRGSSYSVCF